MDKQSIRKAALALRGSIVKEQQIKWSALIIEKLKALPEYIASGKILLYYSINKEVDTRALLQEAIEAKTLYLPRLVHGNEFEARVCGDLTELVLNQYKIPEPSDLAPLANEVDLVVLPGVAFDVSGGRLGMGKGYYDRFLAGKKALIKVAVAYEQQILDAVPKEPYDELVDIIITEKRVIRCSN